jgi:hypothetical protein
MESKKRERERERGSVFSNRKFRNLEPRRLVSLFISMITSIFLLHHKMEAK